MRAVSRPEGRVEISINLEESGQRVDQLLAARYPEFSRSFVQKLIDEGEVRVDGVICRRSTRLQPGVLVELTIPPLASSEVEPQDIPLDIVYEDDDLAVVDKPKGMVVHPNTNDRDGTLVNALLFHLSSLSGINGVERPGIVHRIDKDTTGLLVVAKHDVVHRHLSDQFRDHSIERTYAALCWGRPTDRGTIEGLIGRDQRDRRKMSGRVTSGKHAVTHYELLEDYGCASLVRCALETGRTHQIRVHFSEMHHPLVADPVYGGTKKHWLPSEPPLRAALAGLRGQLLHAATLGFIHPTTDAFVQFHAPPHPEFRAALTALRRSRDLPADAPGPWTPPA